ncbi:MAG: transposase [Deltaproteobacteria bacterium]|nr:transposase [Deltaproteobacteria bacterium]
MRWIGLALRILIDVLRPHSALVAENLLLRHQLAVLRPKVKRPLIDFADRLFWVLVSRLWDRWRDVLVLVEPDTVIRWHRSGFRSYWRRKSRRPPGRPPVSTEIRALVRQMSLENPLWGAPRIHGEILKLGISVSESTVAKYMVRRGDPRRSQTWRTFLRNHARELVSIDFFTVPTARFATLYVFLVLAHDRRRIVHLRVTAEPSSAWVSQQMIEAFPWETTPRFLIRDRDSIYSPAFQSRVDGMGIDDHPKAPRSPWQNPYVERLIGSIRRDLLDHVIVFNASHLERLLRAYLDYYHRSRNHLALGKDPPEHRAAERFGKIVALPQLGGLHHRYTRLAA